MAEEMFRPIPGYPGYEASKDGRIRSFYERGGQRKLSSQPVRILTPQKTTTGYLKCVLRNSKGEYKNVSQHRAVLLAWEGPPGEKQEAAHVNGDRENNHLTNLVWATKKENELHKIDHGRSPRGSRNTNSKLSEGDVRAIRLRIEKGETGESISRDYPVGPSAVWNIMSGVTWGWLP